MYIRVLPFHDVNKHSQQLGTVGQETGCVGGKHGGTKGTPCPAPMGTPLQAGQSTSQEEVAAQVEELRGRADAPSYGKIKYGQLTNISL